MSTGKDKLSPFPDRMLLANFLHSWENIPFCCFRMGSLMHLS